jgi:tetratricopeptide (TPR) repeat protein
VALVVAGVSGKLKTLLSSPASRFLLIAALGGAGLVVVFDPKLGMLRDWDLFAFASIPILILWSLLCLGPGRIAGLGRALAVLTIILNLAVLVPRIAVAMSTERSLRMVEQIFKLERAKSKNLHFLTVDYLRSHGYKLRGDSLAKTIFTRYPEINLHERAVALFDQGRARESIALDSQALAINPSFYDPYTSMCAAYGALNQLDKALEVGEIVFGLNPRHPGIAYNLANITARLARVDESKRYLEIALNLDSAYQPALYGMASIAVARGDGKELQRWLVLLPVQDTVDSLKFADLVSSACLRDMFDLAADMLRFGLEHRLDTAVVLDFVRRYPQIQIREK